MADGEKKTARSEVKFSEKSDSSEPQVFFAEGIHFQIQPYERHVHVDMIHNYTVINCLSQK